MSILIDSLIFAVGFFTMLVGVFSIFIVLFRVDKRWPDYWLAGIFFGLLAMFPADPYRSDHMTEWVVSVPASLICLLGLGVGLWQMKTHQVEST